MDYSQPQLVDRLAAEYALGTLRGGARRRFESLLSAHPGLRAAARDWSDRLMPLSIALEPVQPSGEVWRRVSERIGGDGLSTAGHGKPGRGAWASLGFWRALSAFASIAAIGMAVLLANPPALAPPIVVVLAPTEAGGNAGAGIVASISGDRATLVTKPIVAVAARADRSLELWAVPTTGAPRSLGVLPVGDGTVALRRDVLAGSDTLAVTVEPVGGSPTGKPTGPIVYAGKFTL